MNLKNKLSRHRNILGITENYFRNYYLNKIRGLEDLR